MCDFSIWSFSPVSSVANLISTEVFNVAFHPILPSIICSGSDDRAREPSRSLWFIAYLQAHDKVVSLWFKIAEFSCQKANPESHISSSFRKLNAGFCSIHVFWLNSNAAFTCAEGLTQIRRCFAMLRVGWRRIFCVSLFQNKCRSLYNSVFRSFECNEINSHCEEQFFLTPFPAQVGFQPGFTWGAAPQFPGAQTLWTIKTQSTVNAASPWHIAE